MIIVYATLVALLAAALLWHWRDPAWFRATVFAAFAAIALLAGLDSLGAPKPGWAEWRGSERLVVAAEFDPGRAIYVWMRGDPPIAYRLPWSDEFAQKIQKGLREAAESGMDGVLMDLKRGYAEQALHPSPVREPPVKR